MKCNRRWRRGTKFITHHISCARKTCPFPQVVVVVAIKPRRSPFPRQPLHIIALIKRFTCRPRIPSWLRVLHRIRILNASTERDRVSPRHHRQGMHRPLYLSDPIWRSTMRKVRWTILLVRANKYRHLRNICIRGHSRREQSS